MWTATLLPGTFSSSRSALWLLCLVSSLAVLAGCYVWSCVVREIVSLRSKLKLLESGTSESEPPSSALNLRDWHQTTKKIAGAAVALLIVAGVALWYGTMVPQKVSWAYETGGIEFAQYLGDGLWLARFPGQSPKRIKPCGDPIVLKVGVVLKKLEYYNTGWCQFIGADCEVDYLTDREGRVVDLQGRRIFDTKEN